MAANNKRVIPQFLWVRNPGAGDLGLSQACSQDFGQSYLHLEAQMGQDLLLRLFTWKLASYRRTAPKLTCEARSRPHPPTRSASPQHYLTTWLLASPRMKWPSTEWERMPTGKPRSFYNLMSEVKWHLFTSVVFSSLEVTQEILLT